MKEQEKSVDGLTKSFDKMQKVSLANSATQLKMIGNVKALQTLISRNMVGPILKMGSAFEDILKYTRENVTSQQRIDHNNTAIANIVRDRMIPAMTDLVAVQAESTEATEKKKKNLKQILGSLKNVRAMAAGIGLFGLFSLGSASPALQASLAQMSFQFEQLSIIIGDSLVPVVNAISGGIQYLLDTWNNLSPVQKKVIQDFIMLASVILTLSLAWNVLSIAMAAFGVVSAPVLLAIGAIVVGLGLLFYAWENNLGNIQGLIGGFIDLISPLFEMLKGLLDMVIGLLTGDWSAAWNGFIGMVTGGIHMLQNIGKDVTGFFNKLFGMGGPATKGPLFWASEAARRMQATNGLENMTPQERAGLYAYYYNQLRATNATAETAGDINAPSSSGRGGGPGRVLATGGIVPGLFSQAVPIVAHGSEMVLNPSQQGRLFGLLNGSSGVTNNNNQRSIVVNIYQSGNSMSGDGSNSSLSNELRTMLMNKLGSYH